MQLSSMGMGGRSIFACSLKSQLFMLLARLGNTIMVSSEATLLYLHGRKSHQEGSKVDQAKRSEVNWC